MGGLLEVDLGTWTSFCIRLTLSWCAPEPWSWPWNWSPFWPPQATATALEEQKGRCHQKCHQKPVVRCPVLSFLRPIIPPSSRIHDSYMTWELLVPCLISAHLWPHSELCVSFLTVPSPVQEPGENSLQEPGPTSQLCFPQFFADTGDKTIIPTITGLL